MDTGGLSREFFRLIAYHTALKYMDNTGCFKHNSLALQALHLLFAYMYNFTFK